MSKLSTKIAIFAEKDPKQNSKFQQNKIPTKLGLAPRAGVLLFVQNVWRQIFNVNRDIVSGKWKLLLYSLLYFCIY